jgi:hypothetical protein
MKNSKNTILDYSIVVYTGLLMLAIFLKILLNNSGFQFQTEINWFYYAIYYIITLVTIIGLFFKREHLIITIITPFLLPMFLIISILYIGDFLIVIPTLISVILINFVTKGKILFKIISLCICILPFFAIVIMYFLGFLFSGVSQDTIISEITSPNGKYIAVIDESDQGAMGGDVYVTVRKKSITISFGFLGKLVSNPKVQTMYQGDWGERPTVKFIDDNTLLINGKEAYIQDDTTIDNRK